MAEKQTQTPSSSPSLEGPLLVEPLRSEPAVTPAQVCGQRGTCLFPRLTRPPPHPTHSRWSAVRPRCKRDYSVYIFFKERKQNTPLSSAFPAVKPSRLKRTEPRGDCHRKSVPNSPHGAMMALPRWKHLECGDVSVSPWGGKTRTAEPAARDRGKAPDLPAHPRLPRLIFQREGLHWNTVFCHKPSLCWITHLMLFSNSEAGDRQGLQTEDTTPKAGTLFLCGITYMDQCIQMHDA